MGASSKKNHIFEKVLSVSFIDLTKPTKLKALSGTMWNCWMEAIEAVVNTLPVLVQT